MATVTSVKGEPVSEEKQIAVLVAQGLPREYARFIVALESGKTGGDVVAVDEKGNEVRDDGR